MFVQSRDLVTSVMFAHSMSYFCQSRLSKIAGEKMTKENPLITNLGNENRPAKIGEKWSSLYADEWTDLYEDMSRGLKNHEDLETENGDVEKKILKIVDVNVYLSYEVLLLVSNSLIHDNV